MTWRIAAQFRIREGFVELEDEGLAVRMEGPASGRLGFFHGIVGKEVRDLGDEARGGESFFDVVALEIDIGIDLVVMPLLRWSRSKSDVVGGGADHRVSPLTWNGAFQMRR